MANLGKIIADFSTTLNLKVAVGATSATLDSATDDDGVSLPAGTYFFTIDANNSSKEYIKCTLSGTAISSIQSYSRQGALTTGFARTHRKGAIVKMTDFGVIKNMIDMLDDTTPADLTVTDLDFTGTTTGGLKVKSLTTVQRDAITPANGQIIYNTTAGEFQIYQGGAWSTMASGSTQPNASTTVAGKVEEATSAESIAGTVVGGTGADLFVTPLDIAKNTQSGTFIYGTDVGGDDTYVVALTPTLTAYTTGQTLFFKPSTTNTGACTVDFGPGVKNIKTKDGNDPQNGVIRANMIVELFYDGTNFVLATEDFATTSNKGIVEMATDAEVKTGTDQTRYTNPFHLNQKTGKFSRAQDASSNTQTIAHGLGRIPRFVEMTAMWALSSNGDVDCRSQGTYDGTNTNCIYQANQNGTGVASNSTTNIITIATTSISHVATISVDATNITLTWTSSGSGGTQDIQVLWTVI